MISINNLTIEYSAKPVFKDISFFINSSDKIALVGKNGAGKSTLLKILSGLEFPTSGNIATPNGLTIGYLPQQMEVADDTTLYQEVKKVFKYRFELEKELELIHSELENVSDPDSDEFNKKLERADYLQNLILNDPLGNIESDIEKTLTGLGFKRNDFQRQTAEFSGGWRMRIELAKLLLGKPDLLLLDEPTNHLDIESIEWLEDFLINKAKTLIVVSHDLAFLDNVTKRTIEISCGKIYDYKVNYSEFINLRQDRVEQQKRAYEKQQKEIAEIKDFIERFRYKATKAIQVQSRIKYLEKIVPIEIDEVDNRQLNLKFPPAERSGDYPLITANVSKSYGALNVFDSVSITLKRGEKVAFVGKNGEGKTTLVNCIMNNIPFEGEIKIGHNVKVAYFAQNQAQLLNPDKTIFETIDEVAVGEIRLKIKDLLGAFMFGGEDIEKKVKVLSGGEKTRLAMLRLLLQPVNFLILDEPTNHLDIKTKHILKEAIKNFDGTVILVSHDREFLDGLVDKVYEFGDKKVKEHIGGIYEFLQKKKIDSLREIELKSDLSKRNNDNLSQKKTERASNPNLSYKESKERDKQVKKIEKQVKSLEDEITLLENKKNEIEDSLSKGKVSDSLLKEYEETSLNLEETLKKWETTSEELESLKNEIK